MTFTQRPPFDSVPAEVRTALAHELGAAITSSTDCVGGMSPAAAAVLRLSDGRQVSPAGLPEPLDHSPHWNGWRELVTRDRTTLDD